MCSNLSITLPPSPRPRTAPLKQNDAADAFARVHQVEGLVDVVERHGVGNQVVDVDLAVHVPIDYLGHVRAAPGVAEDGFSMNWDLVPGAMEDIGKLAEKIAANVE